MGDYTGCTAVITGGGSGLGAAMADRFADAGARLALLDIDAAAAEAKAAALRERGVDAIGLRVDVGDNASIAAAVATVKERFGAIEVLCANVGVQQFGAIDQLGEGDWQWVLQVNVLGTINTVAAFKPLLQASSHPDKRHIVLTSSCSYFQLGERMGAYVMSKYAVTGYGGVLRQELSHEGINVLTMFPGGMMTTHLESSMAARPAALGQSRFQPEDMEVMMKSVDMDVATQVASVEDATRLLLDHLDARVPYFVTHGGYRHQVEAQQREVLDAFDRMAAG